MTLKFCAFEDRKLFKIFTNAGCSFLLDARVWWLDFESVINRKFRCWEVLICQNDTKLNYNKESVLHFSDGWPQSQLNHDLQTSTHLYILGCMMENLLGYLKVVCIIIWMSLRFALLRSMIMIVFFFGIPWGNTAKVCLAKYI